MRTSTYRRAEKSIDFAKLGLFIAAVIMAVQGSWEWAFGLALAMNFLSFKFTWRS